jgi:cbb3-type cytochrome oxidase maturation protein
MSVIYIVMPVAFVLAGAAVLAFVWAARQGQFDDMETPSIRVAIDDDGPGTGASRG